MVGFAELSHPNYKPRVPIRIHHGVYKEFWEHAYIKPTPPLVTPSKLTPTKTHSTKMIVHRKAREAQELIAFRRFSATEVSLKSHFCLRKTHREVAKQKLFAINISASVYI